MFFVLVTRFCVAHLGIHFFTAFLFSRCCCPQVTRALKLDFMGDKTEINGQNFMFFLLQFLHCFVVGSLIKT
jgi:hypothetical protein